MARARLVCFVLTPILAVSILTVVPAAARRGGGGFEPTDALLACIRSHEQGAAGYATNTGNGYSGAYQMTPAFWRGYSAAIPDIHWNHWGISRNIQAWQAPPVFQDEAARNGIRARGLQPWPTPNRKCKR